MQELLQFLSWKAVFGHSTKSKYFRGNFPLILLDVKQAQMFNTIPFLKQKINKSNLSIHSRAGEVKLSIQVGLSKVGFLVAILRDQPSSSPFWLRSRVQCPEAAGSAVWLTTDGVWDIYHPLLMLSLPTDQYRRRNLTTNTHISLSCLHQSLFCTHTNDPPLHQWKGTLS